MTTKRHEDIDLIFQNMTEGPILDYHRRGDLLLFVEADLKKIRDGLGPEFRIAANPRDPHQAMAWRTSKLASRGDLISVKYHGSGEGDPQIPDAIATPSRWYHMKPLVVRSLRKQLDVYVTWLLNSWDPAGPGDRWTGTRRDIVNHLELPTLRAGLKETVQAGRRGVGGGDLNSLGHQFNWPGWTMVPERGLDRIWFTDEITLLDLSEGPKTGVGPDMQHRALKARLRIKGGGKDDG